jgi:murein DD-endopeptidase MepM/ murein hydrolase activator NlpD
VVVTSRRVLASALLALALVPSAAQAAGDVVERSSASRTGGVSADAAPGGDLDPGRTGALTYGAPAPPRPVARVFRVTRSVREGRLPTVRFRIDEPGVRVVRARLVVISTSRIAAARIDLGRVRTGRLRTVTWPSGTRLSPGTYVVRLHARDPDGAVLARAANATGKAPLSVKKVRPRPRPEISQPQPPAQPTEKVASTGIFPVAGPFSWGNDESRFGAARRGHSHEGQDLMAADGTPVVTPLNGIVAFVDYQKDGAGHYVVVNTDDGRALFFAHLKTNSITVAVGTRVVSGSTIAAVGSTGSSTGPHLHFEIWEGGWRDRGGRAVDPLPQLQAWAG